ncbi:MAG: hypothetical protein Q8J68_07915 [Methanolobus sp.]|uniref:hypothetical protein n=1 Tax=Methanolobus sp. TaxID=1874737 RepID=UPI00272FA1B8|nr:hypothetical protein [Methanolobus sp.]MDP2217194.1 hypothetical protein [Methanolobus sp.]
MKDIRNIELKLVNKIVSSGVANVNIGGQVPSGMKRWVTFIQLDTLAITGASNVGIYLASVGISNPSIASTVLLTNRKMLLMLRATQASGFRKTPLQVPRKPNINCPLFSIASGKWLGAVATTTTGMVTMQYFDE